MLNLVAIPDVQIATGENMADWLLPANTKFYDVFGALEQAETYWPVNAKIAAEDRVYLYLAAPYKQIGFVTEVLETGFEMDQIIESVRDFIKGPTEGSKASKQFMKLRPIHEIPLNPEHALSLQYLKQNGLKGMLMGARKLDNNPELHIYIKEHAK